MKKNWRLHPINIVLRLYIFTTLVSCYPQNISSKNSNDVGDCSKNVFIQYRRSSRNHAVVAGKSMQTITVFLESYFSGKVRAFIGDKLIFSDDVLTEESIGTTGKYFTYDYSKDPSSAKVKILTEDDCLEIKIEKKYKLVYINNYKGKWDVIYANTYPTYE